MSTLSVPLDTDSENALKNLLNYGFAENKAQAARKAILKAEEDAAVAIVLEGRQCIKEGKIIEGNLRDLVKNM